MCYGGLQAGCKNKTKCQAYVLIGETEGRQKVLQVEEKKKTVFIKTQMKNFTGRLHRRVSTNQHSDFFTGNVATVESGKNSCELKSREPRPNLHLRQRVPLCR